MLKRRICYLLLLGEGCYLIMLYDYQGLRFLLCCLIFIPLICLLLLIPTVFFCRVSISMEQNMMSRGEAAELVVTVTNKGLIPVSRVCVCASWKAPGEKEIKVKRKLCGLGRKSRQQLSFELSAKHCGMAEFKVRKAFVCDYLGLFSFRLPSSRKKKLCTKITISPRITPISREEAAVLSLGWLDMSGEREGDLFLRDYQAGDSLQRIYWKLWVKTQELQIRDFELTNSIVLFLEFTSSFKGQPENWDAYLDRAGSLLYFLAEEGMASNRLLEVAWRQEQQIFKSEIADVGTLQAWMKAFLLEKPEGKAVSEEELFGCGLVFRLKEDCQLYYGEQCI